MGSVSVQYAEPVNHGRINSKAGFEKLMGLSGSAMEQKVNVNGSGISLGHPVAATGALRIVTLMYEMKRRNMRYGLETICGGGGHGIAAIVERDI